MMSFELNGRIYETDENDYLQNPDDWNEDVAEYIADMVGIKLTQEHKVVIGLIRDYYQEYGCAPYLGVIVKIMGQKLGEGEKANRKYFFYLFPQGPYLQAYKIAGVPMPITDYDSESALMRWHLWSKTYEGINTCGFTDTPTDPPWLQEGMEDSEETF